MATPPRSRTPLGAVAMGGRRVLTAAWWAGALPRRRSAAVFDPFDDAALRSLGVPRAQVLWPAQRAEAVSDAWSAARWVLDLLRRRADLRARFPHALSEGPHGAFARWLAEGGEPGQVAAHPAVAHLAAAFDADPSRQPRQLYFWRDDLRQAFPLGLLPAGRRGLLGWMLRHGRAEEQLRLEEIWWFILACAENPAAELVRTYRFTPAWQQAHPCGLTRFGDAALAGWIAERHLLPPDAAGLDPARWPTGLSPADEIRLAHAAHEAWRGAHPQPFRTAGQARRLLHWLAGPGPDAGTGLTAEQRAWCAARVTDGTAEALAGLGVTIIGHFCYPSGLRVSVEAMSDAMEAAGIAVARRDIRTDRHDDPQHAAFGGLEIHDVTIIHTQPEPFFDSAFAKADLAPRARPPYRVAYWYWELETVPPAWIAKARQVDEIWTATRFVAEALRQTMPVAVHTILPGVRIGPFSPRPRAAFGLDGPGGRFAFLFSFHMASVMERKNPAGLIRAFRMAFDPAEPVELILKVTSFGRHEAGVAALRAAAAGANIQVLDRVLTPDETLSLIDACDAYVSLHRSEGLGLTMAEAMLLGKPVVATRYSGNLDFMDDGNSLLVDYRLVPLGRAIPPYDAAGTWAEPSPEHAARLMRRLYENQAWAAALGRKARADAEASLSPAAAAARFAARLTAILAANREPGHAAADRGGEREPGGTSA